MKATAERVALSTLIVIAIVALALALWKLKLVLALIFLAFILAAALRPGIDRLGRAGVPRGLGLAIHYLAIAGLLTVALWFVVPRAVDQVQNALGGSTQAQIHQEAANSKGLKHDVLTAIDRRLREVPKASELLHPAVEVTLKVLNHIDPERDELGHHFLEPVLATLRPAHLEANVLAFDVPQLLESLPEGFPPIDAARVRQK